MIVQQWLELTARAGQLAADYRIALSYLLYSWGAAFVLGVILPAGIGAPSKAGGQGGFVSSPIVKHSVEAREKILAVSHWGAAALVENGDSQAPDEPNTINYVGLIESREGNQILLVLPDNSVQRYQSGAELPDGRVLEVAASGFITLTSMDGAVESLGLFPEVLAAPSKPVEKQSNELPN